MHGCRTHGRPGEGANWILKPKGQAQDPRLSPGQCGGVEHGWWGGHYCLLGVLDDDALAICVQSRASASLRLGRPIAVPVTGLQQQGTRSTS